MGQDLFYSKKEKKLFLITGYDHSHLCKEMISVIQNNYNHMVRISGGVKEVYTDECLTSSRYKNMRYYWCETDVIPDGAFIIGDRPEKELKEGEVAEPDWTMYSWLRN